MIHSAITSKHYTGAGKTAWNKNETGPCSEVSAGRGEAVRAGSRQTSIEKLGVGGGVQW